MNLRKPQRELSTLLDLFYDDNVTGLEHFPESRVSEILMHQDLFQIEVSANACQFCITFTNISRHKHAHTKVGNFAGK